MAIVLIEFFILSPIFYLDYKVRYMSCYYLPAAAIRHNGNDSCTEVSETQTHSTAEGYAEKTSVHGPF